jgi:hypothetical protein
MMSVRRSGKMDAASSHKEIRIDNGTDFLTEDEDAV